MKDLFENELAKEMQQQMRKQASGETPKLARAAECLHAALEILEEQGHTVCANQLMKILVKLAQTKRNVQQMPSLQKLMEAGLTQRDLRELSKGNPTAKAKVNLILRGMGMSEHQIGQFIGTSNVMSEQEAKEIADPGRSFSKMWQWMQDPTAPTDPNNPEPGETLEFKSIAQEKKHDPAVPKNTHEAEKNLEQYGIPLKPSADDNLVKSKKLRPEDVDPDLVGLIDIDGFDIDNSDDDLMGIEIKEDSLEVFDGDTDMSDFEDERDIVNAHDKKKDHAQKAIELAKQMSEVGHWLSEYGDKEAIPESGIDKAREIYKKRPF